jgi:toxin ParE1/3/4
MRVIVHQMAKAELRKSRCWYDREQPCLGLEFLDDVRAAIDKIGADPHLGIQFEDGPYRFYRTKRFPFMLYYLELADHLCVVAVAHERRRPGYWKRRKPE